MASCLPPCFPVLAPAEKASNPRKDPGSSLGTDGQDHWVVWQPRPSLWDHILSSSYSAGSHLSRWSVGAGAPESCLILWLPGSDQLGPGVVILPAEGWSLWRGLGCS